jgi:penicillin-insensitive murein endopeptidase
MTKIQGAVRPHRRRRARQRRRLLPLVTASTLTNAMQKPSPPPSALSLRLARSPRLLLRLLRPLALLLCALPIAASCSCAPSSAVSASQEVAPALIGAGGGGFAVAAFSPSASAASADGARPQRLPDKAPSAPAPPPKPPFVPHYHPFLSGEDAAGSASIGTTSDGYLVGGVPLPQPHPLIRILPTQAARDLAYGARPLIDTFTDAAARLSERHPGTQLLLGNIGRQGGGDIPYSVSHNSGRDADIAFIATNPFGWQTLPQTLLHFNANLASVEHAGFYRFDVPRNAALIEALFASPHSQVQHLFIASHLKRHLLAFWRKHPPTKGAAIADLEAVLSQPSDSAAHDDHLHIRVACSAADICHGCVNTGTHRPWMPDPAPLIGACLSRLQRVAAKDPDPEQRARALERLQLLASSLPAPADLLPLATAALTHASPRVRVAALAALPSFTTPKAAAQALAKRYAADPDPTVRCAIATHLGLLPSTPDAAQALAAILPDDLDCPSALPKPLSLQRPIPVTAFAAFPSAVAPLTAAPPATTPLPEVAARAAASLEHPAPVPALIARLSDPRPAVRDAALDALQRLTNLTHPASPSTWADWYKGAAKRTRDQWLIAGFQAHGFPVLAIDKKSVSSLIAAILGPPPLSYNAQRALMRLTDHHPRSLAWPATDAHAYWLRYARKHQKKLKIKL